MEPIETAHRLQAALPQLTTFLTVARHKSFSGAARELHISTSAVSQSVRQLEELLQVTLLRRTTRAVAPTEAGMRLIERATSPIRLALEALMSANDKPGEVAGRLKVCLPEAALPFVVEPVVPVFRERFPRVLLEVMVENAFVDFVSAGYDAAFGLSEVIARDMVRVRLTDPFKFVVVGSPGYFAKRGKPRKPEDLLEHECINFRWPEAHSLYAWELERGRRKWRVPVRGGIITNSAPFCLAMAERGMGLVYGGELGMRDRIEDGRLVVVLDDYAPIEPGIFLYHPSREQQSEALRHFVTVAKEVLRHPSKK
ncbi:MAG: LysR family transcriptional regulator [Polyangiaceae bacterium]|nr:LysR family transcriptional regulator [Polyangiaceae bacterium]